MTSGYKI